MRIWLNEMFRYYSDFADSSFHVNLLPRTCFVVSELFIVWVRMLSWKGHDDHKFRAHSCYSIWPLLLLSLLCRSPLEHGYIVRMHAKAHHGRCLLLLFSTVFLSCAFVAQERIWKIASTRYPTLTFYLQIANTLTSLPQQWNKGY